MENLTFTDIISSTFCLLGLNFNLGCINFICILGLEAEDTLLVDVEGDNDVGLSWGSLRDSLEDDFAQLSALFGILALFTVTLDNSKVNLWLVVHNRCVVLGREERKLSVLWNHDAHPVVVFPVLNFDTKVEWSHVDNLGSTSESVSHLSAENGSSVGYCLIWVHFVVECLALEFSLKHRLHLWDSGTSSYKDDLVDIGLSHLGAL